MKLSVKDLVITITPEPDDFEMPDNVDYANPWSWCTVKVKGQFYGITASAYVGQCSYQSEQDFIDNAGYYPDMLVDVLAEIQQQVDKIFSHIPAENPTDLGELA